MAMSFPTLIYWCEHCTQYVEPTEHYTLETSQFWGEARSETQHQLRCSLCTGEVEERIACVTCEKHEAESGADECTCCIDAALPVTNRTSTYLRFHADIRNEPEFHPEEQAA
jgi:hypothetical protein